MYVLSTLSRLRSVKHMSIKVAAVLSSRQPKFNLILVKNTSRFARNVSVSDILNELKQCGVYVHFLDLNTRNN